MKLCIGTFFTLLSLCKSRKTRMRDLTGKLIMGLDKDFVATEDDSGLSAVRRGARGLSGTAVEAARKEAPNELAKYFDRNIVPLLEAEKKDIIVLSIIDMLQKDSEIPLDMDVDRYSGMTKESVISCRSFVLPNFLAGIYLYVATDRSYKGVENYVKQVNNNYLEMFNDKVGTIKVERRRNDLNRVNSEFTVNSTAYYSYNTYVFTAAIAGTWDENYAGDKEVIELLSGMDYEKYIETIRNLFGNDAIQMDYNDGCWRFIAREEYLKKSIQSIFDAVLKKAQMAMHKLCAEIKPCYELPSQQRWCAAAFGKKNYYSDALRKGMAEFWAYIGNNKTMLPSCNPNTVLNLYYKILQDIFYSEDWRIIEGANVMMSLLAEGDPDSFLYSVERNIAKKNSSIVACLNEFEKGITKIQYGVELILAVELLTRYEKYFQQATVILFELSKYNSNAKEIMEQVMYPGNPLTTAKKEIKIGLLKGLFSEDENRAWDLYMSTLPMKRSSFYLKMKPKFLPSIEIDGEKRESFCDDIIGYYGVAAGYMQYNYKRCIDMIKAIKDLPDEIIEDIYSRIKESVKSYTQDEVYYIWNEAYRLLIRQKRYSTASWTMKGERLSQLERFAEDIKPREAEQRFLFSKNKYELYDLFENEQIAEQELERRQQEYIRTLYEKKRLVGILRFAASTTGPIWVGAALAHVEINDEEFIDIAKKMESTNEIERLLSAGFFKVFSVCNDEALRRTELIGNSLLRSKILAIFKLTAETIHVIDGFSKNAKRVFWENVNVYTANNSVEPLMSHIILNLTEVKRFEEALFLISRNEQQIKDRELSDVVYKILKTFSESENTVYETYNLQRVIKWFQRIASKEKVIEIEWKFLNIMEEEQNCKPIAIYDEISNNPKAFIDVFMCVYKGSDFHGEKGEDESRAAEHCFNLLWKWKQVPGSKSDGSFSLEVFNTWITEVVSFLEEGDLHEICMERIGETLFHAPEDNDFFLNKDIAMFLQKDKEGYYRRGYEIEALNSSGIHEINKENPLEYRLEKEYLLKANQAAQHGYFRLSETLKSIATEYHARGDRCLKE